MAFTVKKVLRRVLRRGSEKGVSRRCQEHPLGEYDPLGMRPKVEPLKNSSKSQAVTTRSFVIDNLSGGNLFYLQLELSCLQLSFFAYSPLKALIRYTFPL